MSAFGGILFLQTLEEWLFSGNALCGSWKRRCSVPEQVRPCVAVQAAVVLKPELQFPTIMLL